MEARGDRLLKSLPGLTKGLEEGEVDVDIGEGRLAMIVDFLL